MRDPLFDLVRRTRRPESTVQPRLPSAYEPSAQGQDLVVDEDIVTRTPATPAPPIPTRADGATAVAPMPRERRVPSAIDPPAMRTSPPAYAEALIRDPRAVTVPAPVTNEGAPARTVPATPLPVFARAPVAVEPIAQAVVPRTATTEVVPRKALVIATIQPAARVDVQRELRVGVAPSGRRMDGDQERSAPDIRISIGRIEVRATAAERPPARRQASSAPPLTLDDYLAARARRGTR